MGKLTAKMKRFCEEYIVDFNATQAAIRAGYSKNTARAIGAENLTKPLIAGYIRELSTVVTEKAKLSVERTIEEALKIGYSDIRDVFNRDGSLKNVVDWPDSIAGAVAAIETVRGSEGEVTTKVKFWDKNSALEKLFKHQGLYEQDNAQKNPVGDSINDLSQEKLNEIADRLKESISGAGSGLDRQAKPARSKVVTH